MSGVEKGKSRLLVGSNSRYYTTKTVGPVQCYWCGTTIRSNLYANLLDQGVWTDPVPSTTPTLPAVRGGPFWAGRSPSRSVEWERSLPGRGLPIEVGGGWSGRGPFRGGVPAEVGRSTRRRRGRVFGVPHRGEEGH